MSRLECKHPTLESACADCLIEARAKLQAAEAEVDEIQRQWDQRVDLAERLLAEVARLREALEQIAGGTYEDFGPYKAEEIARAALEVGK